MIKIAILGFGVVGGGTAEVLTNNFEIIKKRTGSEIEIKYILDLREFPDSPFANKIVHDFNIILNDPEIKIVVEAMGGAHPAYDFSKAALLSGKHVVTSNKLVVAEFGTELLKIAEEKGVRYQFEASVGGGIPVIQPILTDLVQNNISEVSGILNGTTNYILTQMIENGTSFDDALRDAQKKGYAEADPTADIEGHDAARKIVILGALIGGKLVHPSKIHTEGITKITSRDTYLATLGGYAIKLIGYAKIDNGKLLALVSPRLVPKSNPLNGISDVFNGVLVSGDMVGDVMFYGPGAGKLPTASAVASDVIGIAAGLKNYVKPEWTDALDGDIADFADYSCRRYFHLDGAKTDIDTVLPDAEYISDGESDFAVITQEMTESDTEAKAAELSAKGVNVLSVIRLL